jgi:esterase FrsA
MINRLMWIWRGIDPREILDVQARIVMSEAERTDSELYDTVVGYRGGNWIYEWSKQAMLWQQKASQEEDATRAASTGCMRPISTHCRLPPSERR